MEAEGNKVTVCDRLGDTLTHKGNGQTPHKWVCVAWRQAEANATYSQVLLGDKGNGLKYYQGHEKGQKIDVSESRWARSKVSVLSHLPLQDGRTGPRDRHHRDERGRFALEPVHLLLPGEDARRQGCEKMRVSSHWAAVPVHSVSMPMLLLLSCAARSQTQNKAVAQWGVCACLCATVALAKQAPADQEPRELRRANCCVLRRRVMEPHSLSATLCAKRYCTWLGGAVGRRAAPRGRWWGRGVARARAEELTADF